MIGLGCMRLSTSPERDEDAAIAVVHAALDAGVRLLDTADVYGHGAGDLGHNERLIARALASWSGDAGGVRVATKGGLTRPGGRWVPDGRAKHLERACEASCAALGAAAIDLYQLHVVDPKTPLATSVRALARLRERGVVRAIGLCNVTVAELEQARGITEIAAVQVELGPHDDTRLLDGVAAYCARHGIELLAARPFGGEHKARRLERNRALAKVANARGASVHEVALAWLAGLGARVVPLPGATTVAHARSLGRAAALALAGDERDALDAAFPAAARLRVPLEERAPAADGDGEVVIVMGIPGAGKSTLAREHVARGYARLNRDTVGGTMRRVERLLDEGLAGGGRRWVLDNVYAGRASRARVVEIAWRHGVPVRCVFADTPLEEAQINAARRLVARRGRLLEPDELKAAAREDPNLFPPNVQFRLARALEPPAADEGFAAIDVVAFERTRPPDHDGKALLVEYDGVLRRARGGTRTPRSPDDVELAPGATALLDRYAADGYLLLGLAWLPEIAAGELTAEAARAVFARTHELLGRELEHLVCPHPPGPPVCWCRKPLPGRGVAFIDRHRLDPARCVHVGRTAADRTFAERLGFRYVDYAAR